MRIRLSQPDIGEAEIQAVVEVLRSRDLSLGPALTRFEERFAARIGAAYAVALSSGTAALHVGLLALGIGPGDEVLTTPFSFIASANAALMAGAAPRFADIDPQTWNADTAAMAAAVGPRTRCLLPVHVFGVPAEMGPLRVLAARHGLAVLEDACEALGATWAGAQAGSLGDAAAFGFYPNKQMTTGEGGMLVTSLAEVARLARSLRNQGRDGGGWLAHPRLGFNYRLSDVAAALGTAQLERLDDLLARRARVAGWYRERLAGEERLAFQQSAEEAGISWFVMVLRLADRYTQADRDRILRELQARGIGCSNYFTPIHLQPFYVERFGYRPGDFPHCEALAARTVALPFHPRLTEGEVDEVCTTLRRLL
jgi:perosamine synthetase